METGSFQRSVPLSLRTRLCIILFLCLTLGLTLYGHIKGYKYSFVGLLVGVLICVFILLKITREQISQIRENAARHNDAQMSLFKTDNDFNVDARLMALWGERRPPSYCADGDNEDRIASPPSYQEATRTVPVPGCVIDQEEPVSENHMISNSGGGRTSGDM